MGLGGISSSDGGDNRIVDCEVAQTGSRSIALSAGDRRTLTAGNCVVSNNHLHHAGRFDWGGGRGVTLSGCGNQIANNLIHHCPTGAISYSGNEHLLELNEIHDVCLLYGDVGVFYTGRDWASQGNVVRWNYIHDVAENHGFGSQAFYLDDCDSGDVVMGNIVFGGAGKGVVVGGGRDNTIQGNIFIQLPVGIHVDARGPRGITLDQPGSWNLKAKCEQVGYQSELWKQRYPKLATVLENDPLMPLGNVMCDNIFVACDETWSLRNGVKEQWLTREQPRVFRQRLSIPAASRRRRARPVILGQGLGTRARLPADSGAADWPQTGDSKIGIGMSVSEYPGRAHAQRCAPRARGNGSVVLRRCSGSFQTSK